MLFADAATALRAIVGTGRPLPPGEDAPDAGGQAGLDPAALESAPYLWHRGRDFVKGGTPVRLLYRMATEADRRDPHAPHRSRYLWKAAGGGGGGGRGGRGGGRGRGRGVGHKRQGREEEEEEERGGGDGGDGGGDVEMRRQRGERGGQQLRRRQRKRLRNPDGSYRDVEMGDAEDGGDGDGSGSGREGGGKKKEEEQQEDPAAAAAAAAKAAEVTQERFGVTDLRAMLKKQHGGGEDGGGSGGDKRADGIGADAPGAWEEVVPENDE